MDSLISDSTFVGKQKIYLGEKTYDVMMDETFHIRVDTTYSTAEIIKTIEIDTLYRIGIKNEDNLSLIDTIWVNSNNFNDYQNNTNYVGQFITHYENPDGLSIEVDEFNKNENVFIEEKYNPKTVKLLKE